MGFRGLAPWIRDMPYKKRTTITVRPSRKRYLLAGKDDKESWGDYLRALLDYYRAKESKK